MKKVLIPLAHYVEEKLQAIQKNVIRNTYLMKMYKYDILPILIPTLSPQKITDQLYSECTGVLLLGGWDIDPASYGEELHPNTTKVPKYTDDFEIEIVRRCAADKKPLLGICRGAQIMNVAFGGTMHQEIDELEIDEEHKFSVANYLSLVEGGPRHDVLIEKDSKAFKIMQQEVVETNSGHHQTINKIGKDLCVSGRTAAGVVEVIEYGDEDQFFFGLQAHPEVEEDSFFEPFFKAFAESL